MLFSSLETDYSQCTPSTSTTTPTSTAPVTTPSIPPITGNTLQYAGVNIAGFDFGCGADGTCNVSGAWPPLTQYYGTYRVSLFSMMPDLCHYLGMDGAGQMQVELHLDFLS